MIVENSLLAVVLIGVIAVLLWVIFIIKQRFNHLRRQLKTTVEKFTEKEVTLKHQSRIIEQLHDAVIKVSLDGLIMFFNKGAEKLFGYNANQMIGKHISILHPVEDHDHLQAELIPSVFEKGEYESDTYLLKENNEKLNVFLSISMLYDDQKKPLAMIGLIKDISERKADEKILEENERALQRAQSIAKIGHWKLDVATQAVTGSEELFHIFCLPRNFSTLESFVDIIQADDRKMVMASLQKASDTGEVWDEEYRILTCENTEKYIHAVGHAVKNDAGTVIELIGTAQDITLEKTAWHALQTSRMHFEVMFESIPDAVIFVDVDNTIKMVNKSFQSIFGYTADEILGKPFECLYQPIKDIHNTKNYFSADMQAKQLRYICKGGDEFKGETLASPLVSPDGKMLGQLAIVRDISERLVADSILKSLAESSVGLKFECFLDDVLLRLCELYQCEYAFIGRLQESGKHVKTLAVRAHGKPIDNFEYELAGTPCNDIITKEKNLIIKSVTHLYPDDQMLVDMNAESYFGAPLITPNNKVIGLLVVISTKDLNVDSWVKPVLGIFAGRIALELEREEAVNALQQYRKDLEIIVQQRTLDLCLAKDEAERANLAKSDFLSHMSHELRTPLNAILGFAQMLELDESDFNETQRGDIKEILDAGKHLLKLINEVLDLAKIEAGKMEIYMQPVLVEETVQQCVSLMSQQAQARHIKIINHIHDKEQFVHADSMRFKQILINLISNAIKYNRQAGQIILNSYYVDEDYLRISITDTGKGLTESQLKNLFTAFERLDASHHIEGAGIGLLICKQLVELMAGELGVDAVKDEGCTFWIQLNRVKNKAIVNG